MLALFDPRDALGQAPAGDVVFFLKSNAVGRDLPWPRPTQLIVLDPGPYRGSGADPLTSTAYRALYDSLRDASGSVIPNLLRRHGIEPGGRVAFVGFSAAHGFLSPLLANAADLARIDSVLLMDACFGGSKPGYQAALQDAAAGRLMLVSATSSSGDPPAQTTTLTSGTKCFEESVVEPSGLQPQPASARAPAPEPSGGAWRFGNLGYWLRYVAPGGKPDVAHYNFGQLTLPVMQAYLLPRFRGELGGSGTSGGGGAGGSTALLVLGVAAIGAVALLWLRRFR